MRPDVHQYIQIAGRSTRSRRSLPPQSNGLPVGNAFRDLHFDVAAVDREVHGCAEDSVAKVDAQLGVDVAAAHRYLLEPAGRSAEKVGEDVGEAAGVAGAATSTR